MSVDAKLDVLTPGQDAQLSLSFDAWTKIMQSTERADRDAAQKGVERAYELAGLSKPRIIWCLSPLACLLAEYVLNGNGTTGSAKELTGANAYGPVVLKSWTAVGDRVAPRVTDRLQQRVRTEICNKLQKKELYPPMLSVMDVFPLGTGLGALGNTVKIDTIENVPAGVWAGVKDSLTSLSDAVAFSHPGREALAAAVTLCPYSQNNSSWLAMYEFYGRILQFKSETEIIDGLLQVAKNAGWIHPFEKVCWIWQRPVSVNLDESGRLHSQSGPAMQYGDGFCIYAWHGTWVTKQAIEKPQTITVDQIDREPNAELRSVLLERFGVDRYDQESAHSRVHADDRGVLYRKDIGESEPLVMLKTEAPQIGGDGVRRIYLLRVPPRMTTAARAAVRVPMPSAEYHPTQRRNHPDIDE